MLEGPRACYKFDSSLSTLPGIDSSQAWQIGMSPQVTSEFDLGDKAVTIMEVPVALQAVQVERQMCLIHP